MAAETQTTNQKLKTKQRKARQAEQRYLASLRQRVTQYEGFGDPSKMSKERMEAIIKRGKLKHRLNGNGMSNGMILAMAAMEELHGRRY